MCEQDPVTPSQVHRTQWRPPVAPGAAGPLATLVAGARSGRAYERLQILTDTIGSRLAGSAALDRAIAWASEEMRRDGLQVALESVEVPVWDRGEESLEMVSPIGRPLAVLGLGGTVGTPTPVEAPVVVLHSFEELTDDNAKGRIVVWNVPMAVTSPSVQGYIDAVKFRVQGASRAAAKGAVASLVRSVTTRTLYTPHTGMLRYEGGIAKIPSAAITVEDALLFERLTTAGTEVRLRLSLGATERPDAPSHNVIGEIRGREHPEEIVLLAAHLDTWDVDPGAHDDGAGVVEVMEALRLLKALPEAPRRTVRGVLFTNEENGLRGGLRYFEEHGHREDETHVAAIETDMGGGWPLGFGVQDEGQRAWLTTVVAPVALEVFEEGGGADIGPFDGSGVLLSGLRVDDRTYFDVHHTRADTLDKVDPESLREATAALASFAWLVAEAAEGPPKAAPAPVSP